MIRAFVIQIDLGPSDDPNSVISTVQELLSPVFGEVQVNPWDSPTGSPTPSPTTFPTL